MDSFQKAYSVINNPKYHKIMCAISGGADSDIVMDICTKVDVNHKIEYVWFDTGLEYSATKEHLKYLGERYGVPIVTFKAVKPIPWTCKNVGQPFLSKKVSNEIARAQRHGFEWEDEPYHVLEKKYPKCKQFLKWWCNAWEGGAKSSFNIDHNKYLKDFMIANPPWFNISDTCCDYAKKKTFAKAYIDGAYDLDIFGVRKAEGGARSVAYSGCFSEKTSKGFTEYRPLFWYKNADKKEYEERFNILHSRCYREYLLARTGCACCPFGRNFEAELELAQKHEPGLYVAANNIFKDSYQYTRMYRDFCLAQKSNSTKTN